MIYLPRMCQASGEYKGADIPIVAFRFPWKDAIQGRNESSMPTQNRNQMSENSDKMCSSTFFGVSVWQTGCFSLQCHSGKMIFSWQQVMTELPHWTLLSQMTDSPSGGISTLLKLSLQLCRACVFYLGSHKDSLENTNRSLLWLHLLPQVREPLLFFFF